MDKEIFNKCLALEPPFNGEVLYTKTIVPLDKLRRMVEAILSFLKENQLLNGNVYKVWDWYEHDGYLHPKEIASLDFLTNLTKDSEEFYRNRAGDTYVKLGLYDELSRWYLRIYIIDEYDLNDNDEMGGTLDITSNKELLRTLQNYLHDNFLEKLVMEKPKLYFEKRYAGK